MRKIAKLLCFILSLLLVVTGMQIPAKYSYAEDKPAEALTPDTTNKVSVELKKVIIDNQELDLTDPKLTPGTTNNFNTNVAVEYNYITTTALANGYYVKIPMPDLFRNHITYSPDWTDIGNIPGMVPGTVYYKKGAEFMYVVFKDNTSPGGGNFRITLEKGKIGTGEKPITITEPKSGTTITFKLKDTTPPYAPFGTWRLKDKYLSKDGEFAKTNIQNDTIKWSIVFNDDLLIKQYEETWKKKLNNDPANTYPYVMPQQRTNQLIEDKDIPIDFDITKVELYAEVVVPTLSNHGIPSFSKLRQIRLNHKIYTMDEILTKMGNTTPTYEQFKEFFRTDASLESPRTVVYKTSELQSVLFAMARVPEPTLTIPRAPLESMVNGYSEPTLYPSQKTMMKLVYPEAQAIHLRLGIFTLIPEDKRGAGELFKNKASITFDENADPNKPDSSETQLIYGFTGSSYGNWKDITVEKKWEDPKFPAWGAEHIKPINITLEGGGIKRTAQLTKENNYTYKFTNLPIAKAGKDIIYKVEEDYSANGDYEFDFQEGNAHQPKDVTKIKLYNKPKTTSVKVTKEFRSTRDYNEATVDVSLQSNLDPVTGVIGQAFHDTGNSITLDKNNNFNHTFIGLRKYDIKGKWITYKPVEKSVKLNGTDITAEFTPLISGTQQIGFQILNVSKETRDIDVEKVWKDRPPQPTDVTVHLKGAGVEQGSVVLNLANNLKHKFTNLRRYSDKDGHEIQYTIKEDPVLDFSAKYSVTTDKALVVTNSLTTKVTLEVNKSWKDIDGNDYPINSDTDAEFVVIADGEEIPVILDTNSSNNHYDKRENLPFRKNGVDIDYQLKELRVKKGYEATITRAQGDKKYTFTVVNKRIPTTITIKKVFVGDKLPEVTVHLLEKGEKINTFTLNESNNWEETYRTEKFDEEGNLRVFDIEEDHYDKYRVEYKKENDYNFTITNTKLENITPPTPPTDNNGPGGGGPGGGGPSDKPKPDPKPDNDKPEKPSNQDRTPKPKTDKPDPKPKDDGGGIGGTGGEDPTPSKPSERPTRTPDSDPSTPPTPSVPSYPRNNIPDPNDPNSPETIVVVDENGVPLGTYTKRTNPDGTVEYIDEDGVPLGGVLVKTGNEFPENALIITSMISLLGLVILRRYRRKDK